MKNAAIKAIYGNKPDSMILSELCRIVLGRDISFVMESSEEPWNVEPNGQRYQEPEIQKSACGL